jgi:peptide deformylase
VQHEYDHLDGILYPQRMKDLSLLGFEEEMARYPLSGPEDRSEGTSDETDQEREPA